MSTWQHHRGRVAVLSRDRAPDDPELLDERLSLRAERLALHVQRVVSEAPPLTEAQRGRIAALLRAPATSPAVRP